LSARPRLRPLDPAAARCASSVSGPSFRASFHVKQSSRLTRRMTILDSTKHSTCADHVNCGAFRAPVLRLDRSIGQVFIDLAVEPHCLSVPASCPFRQARDHVALFEMNPGTGTAVTSGPWRQPVGCNDFPRRRAPPSLRTKIAAPHSPPLSLRSQAMQRTRPLPSGSPTRPRWARPCKPKGKPHVDYRHF
jgi:hypothetical protein